MRGASTTLVDDEKILVVSITSVAYVATYICVVAAKGAMHVFDAILVDDWHMLVVSIAGIVNVDVRFRRHAFRQ